MERLDTQVNSGQIMGDNRALSPSPAVTSSGSQTSPPQQPAQNGQDRAVTGRIPQICSYFQTCTGQQKSKMVPCPSGSPPGVSLPPASPHQHLASRLAWGPPAAPLPCLPASLCQVQGTVAASLVAASLCERPLSSLGWSLLTTSSSGGSQPPFVTSQPLTASKASSQCAPLPRTRSQVPPASLQESRAASQQPRPVPLPATFPGPWLSTLLGSALHNCSRPSQP